MSEIFLYIRGRGQEAQREALQATFPDGKVYIESTRGGIPKADREPEELQKLISEAGRGDLIAVTSLDAIPKITAAEYMAIIEKGAELYILQQPYLNSAIYAPEMNSAETKEAAARILTRQLEAEAQRMATQAVKRSNAIKRGFEETGNRGGRPGSKPAGTSAQKEARIKEFILEQMEQGKTTAQIVKRLKDETGAMHVTGNTAYKYIRALQAQDAQEAQPETGAP